MRRWTYWVGIITALLSMNAGLCGQTPGEGTATQLIGDLLRRQNFMSNELAPGNQLIGITAGFEDIAPSSIGNGVRLGGKITLKTAWISYFQAPTYALDGIQMAPIDYQQQGMFTLSPTSNNSNYLPLSIARPGMNAVFSSPQSLILPTMYFDTIDPPNNYYLESSTPLVATEAYSEWLCDISIPNHPSLLNTWYSVQGVRWDNQWNLLSFSDEAFFSIN
jgi:hypothetical protein